MASKALRGSVANGALRRTVSNQWSASSGSSAARGDGVLGQHVERVGRHPHGLDVAGQHPLHRHRAVDQVGAVLGEQHALRDLADLVPGPADALQAAGHRRRCLHLDHQVDRAHVDAQLEAGGGDHGLEPPAS